MFKSNKSHAELISGMKTISSVEYVNRKTHTYNILYDQEDSFSLLIEVDICQQENILDSQVKECPETCLGHVLTGDWK